MRSPRRGSRGVALAVVVLAVAALFSALLLISGLTALSKRFDATAANAAMFAKLNDALARFVMLNKRLPCPASGTAHTGVEDLTGGSTTTCNSPSGVVPWTAIGLTQTQALDPWSRYISYRVFDGATGFTRTNGLDVTNCINDTTLTGYSTGTCAATHENSVGDFMSGKGITVNDFGTAKLGIAYVLLSMGESGYGAYYPGGTATMTMPAGASKEFLNAGSAGTYWTLAASSSDVAPNDSAHFDDAISYLAAFEVVNTAKVTRPWPLNVTLDGTTVCAPPTAGCATVSQLFNIFVIGITPQNPVKMSTAGSGAVTVTGAGSPWLCTVSGSLNGIAPCSTFGGGDTLTTANSETLTFDFKVRRAAAMIKLSGMERIAGSDERAQITFYNGATQVAQITKLSCHNTSSAIGQYLITPGAEFTKIEVKALNQTGGGSSAFAVSAIAACYPSGAICKVPGYNDITSPGAEDCP